MSANNPYGYSWVNTHPLATCDYTVVTDINVQGAFNTIHQQLQRDQSWVSLRAALECIEHLRKAAVAFAQAEHPQWKPK